MDTLALAHRWAGGFIGLLLAVLGLSGTLLIYEDAWVRATVPHAADTQVTDTAAIAASVGQLLADPDTRPSSIVLSSAGNGVHRLYYGGEAGAYASQAGEVVTRWTSKWDRVEVWLFDLHHHLLAGETGEAVAGAAALAGLVFVVTGLVLWWRTWRLFSPRPWPRSLSRLAIVQHHRDMGALAAPLLFLALLTGAMMTMRPVSDFVLSPLSSAAQMRAATAPPTVEGGPLAERLDWPAMLGAARARFPDAEFRTIGLPRKPGGLISLRMRQPAEWLPNGRTNVWFEPSTGEIVAVRDALRLPTGSKASNMVYPLHAAKVGGLVYTALMTVTGLVLTLLGTLAVFSFWFASGSAIRWRRRAAARERMAGE
ncbi:PepSY-associated TM helix domain-containing protein [Emcibacter sp. SYSU 3D8]|uniref:PepSY-associated TM helix domain-containing protein n=1 Tax=Emcibacter sp. SYSU 3D8 TaxID=3133969 RepID=UPI0031FEF7C8